MIKLTPVKGRAEFFYDVFRDPVVEFSRCYLNNHFIRAGRLYRIDKCWGDDRQVRSKSAEFVKWADQLFKLAKGSLIKVEQGCYAGTEALKLRQAGIAFEGLDVEIGSIPD